MSLSLLQPIEPASPVTLPVKSSLGKKYVMAVTGVALIGFVIIHMSGNLLIYAGKDALNAYAHALSSKPGLLWTARILLLAIFVVHVLVGLVLTWENQSARPIRYACNGTFQATWASRHMLLTGLVILAFVIYHLLHFTLGVTDPTHFKTAIPRDPNFGYLDVASMEVAGFRQPAVAIAYIIAQIFLGLHLWHGARSWFQSLGLNKRGYYAYIQGFAVVVTLLVAGGNISIPLAIVSGLWRPA